MDSGQSFRRVELECLDCGHSSPSLIPKDTKSVRYMCGVCNAARNHNVMEIEEGVLVVLKTGENFYREAEGRSALNEV